MSARVLVEVGLRLIGLWYVFASIESLVNGVSYVFYGLVAETGGGFQIAASVIAIVVAIAQIILALAIIRWAPAIAAYFYPAEVEKTAAVSAIGPGDIYHVACFGLGAYCLVQGTTTAVMLIANLMARDYQGWQTAYVGATFLVYTASGLLLIFGAKPIAEFIGSIRHDPESIPRQQFSLKLLLIVTGIVAVVLGIAHALSNR